MKLSSPIHILKSQAKALKKAENIRLVEALNLVAQREGFGSWSLLQAQSENIAPRSFKDLLHYFQPSDLALIGARPGIGKTNFTIGLFVDAIRVARAKHFLFTLSEVHKNIAGRIGHYDETIGTDNTKFILDYSEDIHADYIIEKTRGELSPGSIIVIDYLQLLDHRRSNPELQVQIDALKNYAKTTGSIFLFISQLRREVEARVNKRPTIADVKLVNPLELKSFNKILFLHRDSPETGQTEVIFCRPVEHSFQVGWNEALSRFE